MDNLFMTGVRIFGIDGDGTSARAVLADGCVHALGAGAVDCSHYHEVGEGGARTSLRAAVDAAFSATGCRPEPVQGAFLGSAGCVNEADYAVARRIGAGLAAADRIGIGFSCYG